MLNMLKPITLMLHMIYLLFLKFFSRFADIMEDAANLDVRINTEMNGDVACSTRFQNTTETIPSPLTPGIEPSSSNSEATITLCKEIEHENSCNKPKHNVTCGHGGNFLKCMDNYINV